jgi:dienelactone hydrolase
LDEPCQVVVHDLSPRDSIEMSVECDYGPGPSGQDRVWRSRAVFTADDHGVIDLASDAPVGGDWTGDASGHGPWWSARLTLARSRRDMGPVVPTSVEVRAAGRDQQSTVLLNRRRWHDPVALQEVDGDGWTGKLWLPPSGSSIANLLWLGGSRGGDPNAPGGLLASRGINTLAVSYFRARGLPATLRDIPVELAAHASRLLRGRSEVDSAPVVLGISRGSELALLAAAHFPQDFAAAVGVVPSGRVHGALGSTPQSPGSAWSVRGEPVAPRSSIPTHRIPGPLLLLSAQDDQLWPSPELAQHALDSRHDHGHPLDEHICYAGAGHNFFGYPGIPRAEPPKNTNHPITGRPMNLGGTARANAIAGQQAWHSLLDFIRCVAAATRPQAR